MVNTSLNNSNITDRIPLEDFFRNPEKSSFKISPDGTHFSYMAPYKSRMNIFIQKISEDTALRITSETERDVAGYFWGNNRRILFLKDCGGDENYQLYGVDIDGKNPKSLTPFEGVRTDIIDSLDEIPEEVIIGLNKRNPEIFDPYRLNIVTGELSLLAENPGNIHGWMTDHDGALRVASTIDGVNTTLLYRDDESMPFKEIITTNFKETLSAFCFTYDNKNLYVSTNINRDKAVLAIYDPKIGQEVEVLYENSIYDINGISTSKKEKKILAVNYMAHAGIKQHFFDQQWEMERKKISDHFPGYSIAFTSQTKDEKKFILLCYSDKCVGTYYYYNSENEELIKLADLKPWLNEEKMCAMLPVSYNSRDGLTIEAYLTLPFGLTIENGKNLPVVINPHGGPWARDDWSYNSEVQFLANNGFAVLQMNFRGSTGYGRHFFEKSFKQWGRSMQDDISDGVLWLIEKGIANPKKIGIYGGSYGGYATLAGLTLTPELYACGVDYVGVSNLFTFMKTIPPYWKPMLDMMYEMVGDPDVDKEIMTQTSPVFHCDKICAPLFIAQGANDPRVNKDESDQMVKALKERNINIEYMVKENEGHGFHNEENRIEFYQAMIAFLEKHLK